MAGAIASSPFKGEPPSVAIRKASAVGGPGPNVAGSTVALRRAMPCSGQRGDAGRAFPGSTRTQTPGSAAGSGGAGASVCLTADYAARMKLRVLLQTPAVKDYWPGE